MERFFRHLLVGVWLGLSVTLAASAATAAPKAEWRIEVQEDEHGDPHSRVDLILDGRHVVSVVSPKEISKYEVLPREKYGGHDVPASALCACMSWWAGAQVDYYVTSGGEGRFNLFERYLDEGPSPDRYRKIRTITVKTTIKVQPHEPTSGERDGWPW